MSGKKEKKRNPYEGIFSPEEKEPSAPRGRSKKRAEKVSAPKRPAAKKTTPRGAGELRKQKINDFFDVPLPKGHPENAKLASSMSRKELRLDVDNYFEEYLDPDERAEMGTPWYKTPENVKEEFISKLNNVMGPDVDKMQDDLNRQLRGENTEIENEAVGTPIFLPTGHNHTDIMIPDDLSTYKTLEELEKQKFSNVRSSLTRNEIFHLSESVKYNVFETFIHPRIVKYKEGMSDSILSGTIRSLDAILSQRLGTRIDGVERFLVGKGTASKTLFCLSYPAENRGLMWLALIVQLDGPFPSEEIKPRRYYGIKRFMEETITERILALSVSYLGYFYYACPCRRPERKEKPAPIKRTEKKSKKT